MLAFTIVRVFIETTLLSLQVKTGSLLNIVGVLVTVMATLTWGMTYFDLSTLPWATNATYVLDMTHVDHVVGHTGH